MLFVKFFFFFLNPKYSTREENHTWLLFVTRVTLQQNNYIKSGMASVRSPTAFSTKCFFCNKALMTWVIPTVKSKTSMKRFEKVVRRLLEKPFARHFTALSLMKTWRIIIMMKTDTWHARAAALFVFSLMRYRNNYKMVFITLQVV